MFQELADHVWENPRFQSTAKRIEQAWLARELQFPNKETIPEKIAAAAMSSAAILAASTNPTHRIAALRLSTYTFELFEDSKLPVDAALRVVLARLGNFPSIKTRHSVSNSISSLPISLVVDEYSMTKERQVIVGENANVLTNFQHQLWTDLTAKRSIALAAPTSGGKSFVLELYLASQFATNAHVVTYIVPTRALISQVSEELAKIFENYKIPCPEIISVPAAPETKMPRRSILVMTQERLHIVLQNHPRFVADIIVVDEAHAISDGARGILLQTVIDALLKRRESAQVLFASPLTRNLETFGDTFRRPDVLPRPSKEPTVSQNFIIIDTTTAGKGNIRISAKRENGRGISIGDIATDIDLRTRVSKLSQLPLMLAKNQPNLIYANGADEAEEIALRVAKELDVTDTPTQIALARLAKSSVHSSYVLADCVRRGVGFHYANIPTQLRQEIENAFKNGEIAHLVCTSTLLQGVNLPAKNLFLLKPTKGQHINLAPQDFWNLTGRAGRMLKEFQGNIFLIDYDQWRTQPLAGPREIDIQPAITKSIVESGALLSAMINAKRLKTSPVKRVELETAFVRLLTDQMDNTLDRTLAPLRISPDIAGRLTAELQNATKNITLPASIIRRNHNVSAHRQQRLYRKLRKAATSSPEKMHELVPVLPEDGRSYDSYSSILEMCHDVILGIDTTRGLHRFHALLARRWMAGWSIPRIVTAAIRRWKKLEAKKEIEHRREIDTRQIIRDTLRVLEEDIRFQTIRLFGCYKNILQHMLYELGEGELAQSIPDIELFLEIGASNESMINLLAIGLSRPTAIRLVGSMTEEEPELKREAIVSWLSDKLPNLEELGFSPLQISEVEQTLLRLESSQ